MTGNGNIPLGQFKASCPQCGAELRIEHDGVELKGNERLICPVHGNVMSLQEARRIIFEKNRDSILDKARSVVRDLWKKGTG